MEGPFSLHVADLSFRSKTPELREAFGKYGTIVDCTVCKHPGGESRGFGFVTFSGKADADAAIAALDGKELADRTIKVQHSRRKGAYQKTPGQYCGPKSLSSKYGGKDGRDGGGGLTRHDVRRESERYRPYAAEDKRGMGGGLSRDSFRDRYDRYEDRMAPPSVGGYGGRDRYDGGGYGRDRYDDRGYGGPAPRGGGGYAGGGYPDRGYGGGGYGGYDGGAPPRGGYGDYPPRGAPPADYGRGRY